MVSCARFVTFLSLSWLVGVRPPSLVGRHRWSVRGRCYQSTEPRGSGKCWHHAACERKKMLTLPYTLYTAARKNKNKLNWTETQQWRAAEGNDWGQSGEHRPLLMDPTRGQKWTWDLCHITVSLPQWSMEVLAFNFSRLSPSVKSLQCRMALALALGLLQWLSPFPLFTELNICQNGIENRSGWISLCKQHLLFLKSIHSIQPLLFRFLDTSNLFTVSVIINGDACLQWHLQDALWFPNQS